MAEHSILSQKKKGKEQVLPGRKENDRFPLIDKNQNPGVTDRDKTSQLERVQETVFEIVNLQQDWY